MDSGAEEQLGALTFIKELEYRPDGAALLAMGDFGWRLFDLASGDVSHQGRDIVATFSPAGDTLATFDRGVARLVEVETGAEVDRISTTGSSTAGFIAITAVDDTRFLAVTSAGLVEEIDFGTGTARVVTDDKQVGLGDVDQHPELPIIVVPNHGGGHRHGPALRLRRPHPGPSR